MSIPRQLNSCRGVLPDQAVIVAHFYDIESGRKKLEARGYGRGHERFSIPVPREGGIQDLLEEAERSDRRFDVVICESIERIARRTYVGTLIENRLEEAGVPLLASDEPINLTGKRATQVLTRRVKQGVAEWYVLELLEKSWGGFEEHTEQGYNVGKPPYGHIAEKIPHPVPARRAEGASKHRLKPDPVRGPVVTRIFALRVEDRLGYKAIANVLNQDLDQFPPPEPVDPNRAVGRWTASSVREVLTNPKHTGYMVWNRRATKSNGGKLNPPQEWVWSSVPTHEPLATKETFIEAQKVANERKGSRNGSKTNSAHPDCKRSYAFRSYLICAICEHRMRGKFHRETVYYLCDPAKGYVPDGHPKSFWLREDILMDAVSDFFSDNVFGPHRQNLLGTMLTEADDRALRDHQARLDTVRRAIEDIEARRRNLVRTLERTGDPDDDLFNDIRTRSAELSSDRNSKLARLEELEQTKPVRPRPELLDLLPTGPIRIDAMPEELQRKLFEAFRLQIRYDRRTDEAECQITLAAAAIRAQQRAAQEALAIEDSGRDDHSSAPMLCVPPRGYSPAEAAVHFPLSGRAERGWETGRSPPGSPRIQRVLALGLIRRGKEPTSCA
ncbi:recombinase family protein [Actinomadura barringtoniae]|uniref:Recombinase family protein n=1 Tax=Actinomadura barringtoniae TaxID=1427535 RepID=A0A939PLN1_9ACTN|nr:recombinase family protein [Actinomadura barringtoniae]